MKDHTQTTNKCSTSYHKTGHQKTCTNKLSCKSKTPFADYPQYGKHPHQFYAQLINNKTVKNLHRQINGHYKNNINVILVS